jgi:hypothetical protein
VTEPVTYVIDNAENLAAPELFTAERDQVIVAVRITPVYGQVNLGLLMLVIDEANRNDFALVREQPFRDEWMLCVFEAYDEE